MAANEGDNGGWGAADVAMMPGVRKRGMMDTADRPVRKFRGREGGGSSVRTLRSPFVTVSLKWIQGGREFFREERKERSYCEGGSLCEGLMNTTDLFLMSSP